VADKHLTVQELADREGVSPATVYGWNRDRVGPPYIKPGGRIVRYRLTDVIRWEKTQEAPRRRGAA
jgi:predicted DNA-binding transcriptional regulator AlpA